MTLPRAEDEEMWAAVGEPSRRALLDLLLTRGEATASTLASELPVTRQAVSKHLAVLERAGLVQGQRAGREVRYAVKPERLDQATQIMVRVADRWDRRLAAIKRIAEARAADSHGEATARQRAGPRAPG